MSISGPIVLGWICDELTARQFVPGEALAAVRRLRAPRGDGLILDHCRERLARCKCPASLDLVDAPPRDPNAKLCKRRLRDAYQEGRKREI